MEEGRTSFMSSWNFSILVNVFVILHLTLTPFPKPPEFYD